MTPEGLWNATIRLFAIAALTAIPTRAQTQSLPTPLPETPVLDVRLAEFMRTVRVPMGVELLPAPAVPAPVVPQARPAGGPGPGVPLADAMAGLMAGLPGYEWTQEGQVVSVRPVGAIANQENWLNTRLDRFDTTDLTIAETLAALGRVLDAGFLADHIQVSPHPEELGRLPAAIRVPAEMSFSKRFSVRAQNATVRETLDAIVAAHGESGWIAAHRGSTPSRAASRLNVVLWSIGNILVRTDVPPLPLPGASPARRGTMVRLPLTVQRLSWELARLGRTASRPMGQMLVRECPGGSSAQGWLDLREADFDAAVQAMLDQCPGYVAETRNGVVAVAPPGAADRHEVLRQRVKSLRVTDVPAADVLWKLSEAIAQARRGPTGPPPLHTAEARESWQRPVTLALKDVTVRDVLDALVKAHGTLTWTVTNDRSGNPMLGLIGEMWGISVTARRFR